MGAMAPIEVVWRPLPGSQSLAMACPCDVILYQGTRGPGKTDAQLMYFRQHVGRGFGTYWRGVVFDRHYKDLDDMIAKSQRWFGGLDDGAKWLASNSDYKWVWPTGEELLFRHAKSARDYWHYHGQEFPFIGWNELTKHPNSDLYDAMMSCNRSSWIAGENGEGEIPLVVFATANPYGVGHNWVKRRFIDAAEPGQVVRTVTEVYNPRTKQREPVERTQVHLFGSYKENRYLPPEYIAGLESITDENQRRAWLWGDWDIVAGGALDDLWGPHLILPRFRVPKTWRVDRSFDWGSTAPFSVCWWAEANGEEATLPDGRKFCPPKGTLIQIAEWYGATAIGENKGLKLSAKAVAQGIKEREEILRRDGWVNAPIRPGPADNQIRNVNETDSDSIEKKMADEGVYWTESDKRPGSRKVGLQLIRDRLEASKTGEGPALYFMDNCRASIAILPTLPRDEKDPDDIDTNADDHIADAVKYRCLAGSNRYATQIDVRFAL
ncbi:MAG: terminase [Planctomycetaceae bacterium]|nr:terminase [Planctomycetaceae bacterium]